MSNSFFEETQRLQTLTEMLVASSREEIHISSSILEHHSDEEFMWQELEEQFIDINKPVQPHLVHSTLSHERSRKSNREALRSRTYSSAEVGGKQVPAASLHPSWQLQQL